MNRTKKLSILLAVLVVACAITFVVSRYEVHKEKIQNSDAIVLELSSDTVDTLSWTCDGQSFAFHKEETWLYDTDEAFPVNQDKITQLLDIFSQFGVAFQIESPEDLGQYGLDDPVCTIQMTAEDQSYTVLLGDFSVMDSQRYVSIGDGNVYLVQNDPYDFFHVELSDLVDHDEVPSFDQVTSLQFSGTENWSVTYEEDGSDTFREDDVYFTNLDGSHLPLDTNRVDDYLQTLESLALTDYVTYNASQEDLQTYGLDTPELTISVDYTAQQEDGSTSSDTFLLHLSRDPQEQQQAQEQTEQDGTVSEDEEITAYARVGDSQILYQISSEDYRALMKASYDDLRHLEVLPADFENIAQVDISLDNTDYTLTTQGSGEDKTYSYQGEEVDIEAFQTAMQDLDAQSFTGESPTQKEEISFTVYLDLEGSPSVDIALYRYDGTYCLAVVDGTPTSLVLRSAVVDLVEAVHEIVLN
ncbi:MAG: DUF4340 domain-containing protein [Lawsonibacter sp.]|jgi:hypothetical protein